MKLLIALFSISMACMAADVTGAWNVRAPARNGGEMKLTLTIQAGKDSYSGVISNDEGEAVLRDIRVKDAEVTFVVETDDARYEVTATVDADAMKGTYKVNNSAGGNFTGTRQRKTT